MCVKFAQREKTAIHNNLRLALFVVLGSPALVATTKCINVSVLLLSSLQLRIQAALVPS